MRNKKGLSEVVAYVLLIVIAISLSLLVYAWLKGYVPGKVKACPEEVSLVLESYECGENNEINVTLKNNGLFNVQGFLGRYGNSSDGKANKNLGRSYTPFPANLTPSEKIKMNFTYVENIKILEIQPYITDKGIVLCKQVIKEQVQGCD